MIDPLSPISPSKMARAALVRAGVCLIANCFTFVVAAVHIDSHSRASWLLIATFAFIAALQIYYCVRGVLLGAQAQDGSARWVAPLVGVLGAIVTFGIGGLGLVMLVLKATGRGGHGWGGA